MLTANATDGRKSLRFSAYMLNGSFPRIVGPRVGRLRLRLSAFNALPKGQFRVLHENSVIKTCDSARVRVQPYNLSLFIGW